MRDHFGLRQTTAVGIAVLALACLDPAGARAQTALHLISPNQSPAPQAAPQSNPGAVAPDQTSGPVPFGSDQNTSFVLKSVQFQGSTVIPADYLHALWAGLVGKTVSGNDIVAIGAQLAKRYKDDGYALINVEVPVQTYADGVANVVVQEGYVDKIIIEGNTDGADLSLLKAYAEHISADRPLRQSTLERYILLMNDIAGLKVGSTFEPIPGHVGVAALHLAILRKPFEAGLAATSQGNNSLGTSQLSANIIGNSLLREGDSTQLAVGVPLNFSRYQYYGLSQVEPLGSNGATLTGGFGELVTHSVPGSAAGSAQTVTIRLNYPVIRAVHESLVVNGGFDALNSNSAYLGQSLSDERTRSFRQGLVYGLDDSFKGTTIATATLSEGVGILGARRGSVVYGGPDYTKMNGAITREQSLPSDFVVRGKLLWQYSSGHLPSSEQFLFGGPDIGKAFNYAFLSGDRGVAPYIELAHAVPGLNASGLLEGSEFFAYADWGEVWNVNTTEQLGTTHASSAGFGVRAKLQKTLIMELGLGYVVNESAALPHQDTPRILLNVTGHF